MAYREERDALRARVEMLEQHLADGGESVDELERRLRPSPRRTLLWAGVAGGVLAAAAGACTVGWLLMKRAAAREIDARWSWLSACLIGEPLQQGESAVARLRRVELAEVSIPVRGGVERWPFRCQASAAALAAKLVDDGREQAGVQNAAYWSNSLVTKLEHRAGQEEVVPVAKELWKAVAAESIKATPVAIPNATTPARPLHLADLAGASITNVETAIGDVFAETMMGLDRHVLIDSKSVDPAILCTVTSAEDTLRCRRLPGELGHKRGLRLDGTADAGAAPLVFAGPDGADGIFRSDSGELVASVRAYSAYAAANGYVAIQTWPSATDGQFEVIEQRAPHAALVKTTVKPSAQTQPVTKIHRSAILWDKAIVQLVDEKKLSTSPWIGAMTLGKDDLGRAFPKVGDLNWINSVITGCRGASGTVVRVGASDSYLMFNSGDAWRGPTEGHGLEALRCDGADAVFLSSWPTRVKRCTPAGCAEESPREGTWPSIARREMTAAELVAGKIVTAWATERVGVRFRAAPATRIGATEDVVVYDDLADAAGDPEARGNLSGLALIAGARSAILLLATTSGIRAVALDTNGSFGPATVVVAAP